MRGYGEFENRAGVMAHRPPIFKHLGVLTSCPEGVLAKRYLELCLVAVSLLNNCTCVSHHAPNGRAGRQADAARLLDYKGHPSWTRSRLVVECAMPSPAAGTARDEIFTASGPLHRAQIVEVTWRTACARLQPLQRHPAAQSAGVAVREAAGRHDYQGGLLPPLRRRGLRCKEDGTPRA
jgi:hypothetical protein